MRRALLLLCQQRCWGRACCVRMCVCRSRRAVGACCRVCVHGPRWPNHVTMCCWCYTAAEGNLAHATRKPDGAGASGCGKQTHHFNQTTECLQDAAQSPYASKHAAYMKDALRDPAQNTHSAVQSPGTALPRVALCHSATPSEHACAPTIPLIPASFCTTSAAAHPHQRQSQPPAPSRHRRRSAAAAAASQRPFWGCAAAGRPPETPLGPLAAPCRGTAGPASAVARPSTPAHMGGIAGAA